MKILGIDFGTKNTGLAMSDDNGRMSFAYNTLSVKDDGRSTDKIVDDIANICKLEKVDKIVVGMPLNLSGEKGEMGDKVFDFIKSLELRSGLHIDTQDERLTTVQASRMENKNARNIDELSAQIMLQTYLDTINNS